MKKKFPSEHLHGLCSTSVICLNYESTSAQCATTNCANALTVIRSTKQNPMQKSRLRAYKYCAPTCFLSFASLMTLSRASLFRLFPPHSFLHISSYCTFALFNSAAHSLSLLCLGLFPSGTAKSYL